MKNIQNKSILQSCLHSKKKGCPAPEHDLRDLKPLFLHSHEISHPLASETRIDRKPCAVAAAPVTMSSTNRHAYSWQFVPTTKSKRAHSADRTEPVPKTRNYFRTQTMSVYLHLYLKLNSNRFRNVEEIQKKKHKCAYSLTPTHLAAECHP